MPIRASTNLFVKVSRVTSSGYNNAQFSHGYCPNCIEKIMKPDIKKFIDQQRTKNGLAPEKS